MTSTSNQSAPLRGSLALALVLSFAVIWRCGPMPPDDSQIAVSDPQPALATLSKAQASSFYQVNYQAVANRPLITPDAVRQAILADLNALPQSDRAFTRYLTLAGLWNSSYITDDELATTRLAAAKALNSLSDRPDIALPVAVDANKVVLRLDLRRYGWSRGLWEFVADRSAFDIIARGNTERDIGRLTGSRLAHLRADAFIVTSLSPNTYHTIMRLPGNVRTLEARLGIDRDRAVRQGRAIRAGFSASGVSAHNRMIERHETARGGYYWRSFDFENSNGRRDRNLFASPLDQRLFGGRGFREAGGEVIFSLRNGLQGYLLFDGNGRRVDKAPTEVVSHSSRADKAVANGLSCMECHNKGTIGGNSGSFQVRDMVRPHVEANPQAYSNFELRNVRALYADQATLGAAYTQDLALYKTALDQLGIDPDKVGDPITQVILTFESQNRGVDLQTAAAELGMTPTDLAAGLKRSQRLSRDLGGLLVPGGTIQREVLEDNMFDVVRTLGLGSVRARGFVREAPAAYQAESEYSAENTEVVDE